MHALKSWSGLQLRHLLALQAVSEEGSFRRAAAALDYTQSGISQQIRALEAIVGERLIDRPGGSRPVRLTAAGETLLEHASTVLTQISAAQADLQSLGSTSTGTVRLGAFQSIGARLLPALMAELARTVPTMRLELTQTISDPELYELLRAGELDVSFVMLPAPEGPFAVRELFADPFVVVVALDSMLVRRGGRLALRDLAKLPLVTARECRSTGDLLAQARERGIEPNIVHRSDDNGTVLGLVSTGDAVALVPRLVAETANGSVAIMELEEPPPPRRIALCWRADRRCSPLVEAFLDRVARISAELGLAGVSALDRSSASG